MQQLARARPPHSRRRPALARPVRGHAAPLDGGGASALPGRAYRRAVRNPHQGRRRETRSYAGGQRPPERRQNACALIGSGGVGHGIGTG